MWLWGYVRRFENLIVSNSKIAFFLFFVVVDDGYGLFEDVRVIECHDFEDVKILIAKRNE
jgi:hypothetical protein